MGASYHLRLEEGFEGEINRRAEGGKEGRKKGTQNVKKYEDIGYAKILKGIRKNQEIIDLIG